MTIKPVCKACGSDDIIADATATWDARLQNWVVAGLMDKGHSCEDCESEAGFDFVEVDNEGRHTPEPWECFIDNAPLLTAPRIRSATGLVAVVAVRSQEKATEANAHRIVDCVNACNGIDNPLQTIPPLILACETAQSTLAYRAENHDEEAAADLAIVNAALSQVKKVEQ